MNGDSKHRPAATPGGLTRREALQLTFAAGVTATSLTLAVTDPAEAALAGSFLHGVASGDPLQDRVILWTRVTKPGVETDIRVRWTIAEDRGMSRVVREGGAYAFARRDFTCKVDADGLEPGRTYFYRFDIDGELSSVGRTKTLPDVGVEKLKLAVFSCSNYELGLFNAYGEAAKIRDLDAVLHLGDYIYEYGPGLGGYTTPAAALGQVPKPRDARLEPAEEIITLDQYRARHALYKTDRHLRKIHSENAFIQVWDDHEVANDAWTGGAENHQPDTEGAWQARKKAGIRAFYEWTPIREPEDRIDPATGNPASLYRSFDFGGLARLIMLDTREAARDQQLATDRLVAAYAGVPPEGPFPQDVGENGKPRTLIGDAQQDWFDDQIATSTQTWQLIGNQVLMFYQSAPNISGSTVLTPEQKLQLLGIIDQLLGTGSGDFVDRLGAAGLPFPLGADAWTGYPTARIRMLRSLGKAKNPIVLTGDSHNAWAADLRLPNGRTGRRIGVEFGGTSVSSPGYEQYLLGVAPEAIAALFVESNSRSQQLDKLVYAEQARRGFMVVNVTPAKVTVDYVFVSTVFENEYETSTMRFNVPVDRKVIGSTTTV